MHTFRAFSSLMSLLAIGLVFAPSGCDDSDECRTDVDGCDSFSYSCDASPRCFSELSACIGSGDCPDSSGEDGSGSGSSSDVCRQGVTGCEGSYYSCTSSPTCFAQLDGCLASGDCADGGGDGSGDGDGDGSGSSGGCVDSGGGCGYNGECCSGVCIADGGGICADTCSSDSDCYSGCCRPLQGGGSACGPCESATLTDLE